jgi:beta-alanine--pyruvate transaminase
MFERGFYVRWSGDSLAFAPPFVTEREDFDKLINALADTIPTVD